jgi:hypothetical protein
MIGTTIETKMGNDKDPDNDQDKDRLSNQCFQATPRKARLKHTLARRKDTQKELDA